MNSNHIMTHYLLLIILIVLVLFFYTKGIISSIRFNRKYNIKTSISSDETTSHIVVYTLILINIGICVWALFNI